eukprot:1148560-Pelagomonas_calceolata.AAC.1
MGSDQGKDTLLVTKYHIIYAPFTAGPVARGSTGSPWKVPYVHNGLYLEENVWARPSAFNQAVKDKSFPATMQSEEAINTECQSEICTSPPVGEQLVILI